MAKRSVGVEGPRVPLPGQMTFPTFDSLPGQEDLDLARDANPSRKPRNDPDKKEATALLPFMVVECGVGNRFGFRGTRENGCKIAKQFKGRVAHNLSIYDGEPF